MDVRRRQNPPAPRQEQGEETCCHPRGTAAEDCAGWPAPGEGGRRDPAQYSRRAVGHHGRRRSIGPGWGTKTCISTTCARPPAPAWHSQAARSGKSRPLPDTARATWRRSLRRLILAGGWRTARSMAGSPWRCLPGSNILTTYSMAISRSLLGARRTCSLGSARWESAAGVLTCWRQPIRVRLAIRTQPGSPSAVTARRRHSVCLR